MASIPLIDALKSKSSDLVLRLLKSGANPNATDSRYNNSALEWAIIDNNDCDALINLLLKYGAEPDYKVLERALTKCNKSTIKKLILYGANPNGHRSGTGNALHEISSSSKNDRKEVCELLIKSGVQVDHENECYNTPLFFAVDARNDDIIEILLQYGAQPCYKHLRGTPLIRCFGNVSKPTVECMVKYAALQVDHSNDTAMHAFFRNFTQVPPDGENLKSGRVHLKFAQDCMAEINRLKRYRLAAGNVTLFDFVLSSDIKTFTDGNIEKIMRSILDQKVALLFPIYHDAIMKRINRDREFIISKAEEAWFSVRWNPSRVNKKVCLFAHCIEHVVKYLSTKDICNLYLGLS